MDYAAAELGIDRIELRRRNMIRERDAVQGRVRHGLRLRRLSRRVQAGAGARRRQRLQEAQARKQEAPASCAASASAAISKPPRRRARSWAAIRFDADGTVTIVTGTLDYGQGHASTFAQVLTEKLGVPFDRIRLVQGDSDQLVTGGGTGGSRSVDVRAARRSRKPPKSDRDAASRSPRTCWKPPPATSSSRPAASSSPAPTARSASWSWPQRLRSGLKLPEGMPAIARRHACHRSRPRHFPNGVSRRRGGDRSRHRPHPHGEIHRGQRFRHRASIRCWSKARSRAAWCKGSARCCSKARSTMPTANWSPARSWTTPCRTRTTRR